MTSRSRFYWACQIGGWGSYSLIGLWSAARTVGWRPPLIAGFLLYPVYSIALTELLRREARRRQWLADVWPTHWLGIAAGVLIVSTVQTFLIVAINLALEGHSSSFVDPRQIVYVGLGTTGATTVWLLYYLMLTTARRRRERQTRLELALKDAELRSLEAQLNPHFLFNCLNSIRALVGENPAQAQDMITRLASLLRYSLHRGQHLVSLAAEGDAVGDYLALESARFDDRLRVHIDIAPAASGAMIPAMLLQTLVENAVKHGIAPLPAGGDITIRAALEPELVVVEVENSGQFAPATGASGIGLANARDRLRILFGDRATLEVGDLGAGRVLATARIPLTS
ncbi:MAG: histidine kinase [Vicinamibacterales bacterium]